MESKLTKMLKLAPNVADSLEKINYITAVPEQTVSKAIVVSPVAVTPVAVAGPVAAAASGAMPKNVAQETPVALVTKKKINKSVQQIKLTAAKNFAAGQEAAANAGDVSQVTNKPICTDNQDEQLDDCVAPSAEQDSDQAEQEQMEAFDLTAGSKAYGSAASNFASDVSQKKDLAGDETDPAAAAAIAAPAAEEKKAEKVAKKIAVAEATVEKTKEKIEKKAEAKAQAKLAAGDVKGGMAELKKAAKEEAKVEKKIKEMQKEIFANKSGDGELKQDLL